jgi:hypothetical protein
VTPQQRWIDGVAAEAGLVRQFVAVPMGLGYSIEAQITHEEKLGGIQFEVTRRKDIFREVKITGWGEPKIVSLEISKPVEDLLLAVIRELRHIVLAEWIFANGSSLKDILNLSLKKSGITEVFPDTVFRTFSHSNSLGES